MKLKNIILGILVLALASLLIGSIGAAPIIDPIIPDQTKDEDSSPWSLDLLAYESGDAGETDAELNWSVSGVDTTKFTTSFDATLNIITFTPVANANGSDIITLTLTNGIPAEDVSQDITVTLNPINDAPVFTDWDFSTKEIKEKVAFEFDVNATDADTGDVLTYSVTGLPTTLIIDSETGIILGTPANSDEGVYTATLKVSDGTAEVTKTVEFYIKDEYDDGKLEIENVNFEDLTGDEDKHYPGDILEIEVEITNNDIDNIMEDITVYIKSDSLDIDEEIDIDEIDEDSSITELIEIQIPYDAEDATHEFDITVKGQDDSDDKDYHSDRYFEKDLEKKSIKVRRSAHDIIISDMTVTPAEAEAGDTITIEVEIVNIGKKNEDNVEVTLEIEDLGIREVSDEYDLKADKDKTFTFDVVVPEDAESKTYNIEAMISYEGDEDDEEDTPLSKTVSLTVTGVVTPPIGEGAATLTATTTSASAIRGQSTKYELILTNNAATTQTYEIRITGVNDWATYIIEAGGETNQVSLPAGKSIPIYTYITPKTDASAGSHTATVSVYYSTELVDSIILTTDVSGVSAITGAGITFRPSDATLGWIVVGMVVIFGIAIAGYSIYRIREE